MHKFIFTISLIFTAVSVDALLRIAREVIKPPIIYTDVAELRRAVMNCQGDTLVRVIYIDDQKAWSVNCTVSD